MPSPTENRPRTVKKLTGQKRPLKLSEVEFIRETLERNGPPRDLALFNLAIDSKLRASDLLSLKVDDVCIGGKVQDRASIIQSKTKSPVHFEITPKSRLAIEKLIHSTAQRGPYLFTSKERASPHLSFRQYYRIVKDWIRRAGLEPSLYGTHTLRRTKVTHLYRKTGNLRAVQILLGHKGIEHTIRYLGVEVDDALELSGQLSF